MAESPVPIEYYILVYRGDPSVIEPTRVFKYHDHAPASVCVPYGIGAPHTPELNDALDKLSQVLVKDRYDVVSPSPRIFAFSGACSIGMLEYLNRPGTSDTPTQIGRAHV